MVLVAPISRLVGADDDLGVGAARYVHWEAVCGGCGLAVVEVTHRSVSLSPYRRSQAGAERDGLVGIILPRHADVVEVGHVVPAPRMHFGETGVTASDVTEIEG